MVIISANLGRSSRLFGVLALAVCLVLLVALLVSVQVSAQAAIVVNSTDDNLLAEDGLCTLREALGNANRDRDLTDGDCVAGSGFDVITVPAGTYGLQLAGADEDNGLTGDLDIYTDLRLAGADAGSTVINANALDRAFHVRLETTVEIEGITITGGRAIGSKGYGGGIWHGLGVLTVTNSIVLSNTAEQGGGGIHNTSAGELIVVSSVISDNRTTGFGSFGGGIANEQSGRVSVSQSTISHNRSNLFGGGIYHANGDLSLVDTTIAHNASTVNTIGSLAEGGGLYHNTGTFSVVGSTFHDNVAVYGAGIYSDLLGSSGTIVNSTFSANAAQFEGGALFNDQGSLTLRHVTIFRNSAGLSGGGIMNSKSGARLSLDNTIVANSLGGAVTGGRNCSGSSRPNSLGHNLASDGSCQLDGAGDQNATNPVLDDLKDNGGPTWTHAPFVSSPAVDAGNCSAGTVRVDQRGVRRPVGPACDIGAYEGWVPFPFELYLPSATAGG